MKFGKHSFTLFLCIVLIAACSGSDGGSGISPPPPPPPASSMAKIDPDNAESIAGEVADAVFASGSLDDIVAGDSGFQVGKTDSGLSKPGASQADGVFSVLASVPLPETTVDCAVTGSVTVSGDVADPTTLSSGDNLTFRFSACDDGEGQVLNGIFEFDVNTFSGDTLQGLFRLDASVYFDGLEVTEGQATTVLTGDAELELDTTMPPVARHVVFGDSLSASDNTDSVTLTRFRSDFSYDAGVAPEAYTVAASGNLSSTGFGGNVDYSTPVPLMGYAGSYPFAGELLVTGDDGSSVRLIALDDVNVRLQIDPGDGSGIITEDTTWTAVSEEAGVADAATGISGQVLMGPVVPGPEVPGQENEAPFSAMFSVRDSAGSTAGRFKSDDNGYFRIALSPGDYTVVPDPSAPFPAAEQQTKSVTVPEQGFADVILRFDTGMR